MSAPSGTGQLEMQAGGARPRLGNVRLLSAWETHHRSDLGTHVGHFGRLPSTGGDFPERFLASIARAGLRGRGGAGFPAEVKLRSRRPNGGKGRPTRGRRGVVIVNAMEGEPASLKDTVLLSYAPHLVLDGAQLVADAIGAARVVVCVPADREPAAIRVLHAISERTATSLWPVPVQVARPPGHFVAGEESALVDWLSGGKGVPAFRLDRSVPLTLRREPVIIHNAETLAHMAVVTRAALTPEPPVLTSLVTVTGPGRRPGVFEVESGTPLGTVAALGGARTGPGAAARPGRGAGPAAVLVGGYGGTWVPQSDFATAYSYEGLAGIGTSPGAGVLVVLPAGACGLAQTARIAGYMAGQSAGQCGPCVFGLPAIAQDLATLAAGARGPAGARGDPELVARIRSRCEAVNGRGACRHPDGVVRMVQSALKVFADDVAAHAAGRPCRERSLTSGAAVAR